MAVRQESRQVITQLRTVVPRRVAPCAKRITSPRTGALQTAAGSAVCIMSQAVACMYVLEHLNRW